MSKERVTVECLASGQARPYADSVYHYRVLIEWQGLAGYKDKEAPFVPRPELAREHVDRILFGVCGGWVKNPDPWQRALRKCEMVAPGLWDVVIVEPFTD